GLHILEPGRQAGRAPEQSMAQPADDYADQKGADYGERQEGELRFFGAGLEAFPEVFGVVVKTPAEDRGESGDDDEADGAAGQVKRRPFARRPGGVAAAGRE